MTVYFLIRHAATDMVGRAIAGWLPGIHLNPEGRAQAAALAERLAGVPLAAIYSSPLERAQETAAPLARLLRVGVETRERLGEIRFGDWTGRSFRDLADDPLWRRFNSDRGNTRAPGGELMLETQSRVVVELEWVRGRRPNEAVAVISHGDVIKAALAHYSGVHLDLFQRIEIAPASVSIVSVDESGPRILRVNDTGVWPT